jgi:hypothetical protein
MTMPTADAEGNPVLHLLRFLGSASVGIILSALIAAIGLFTWQRRDWMFKENYHRNEIITDRAVNLVEKINIELGHFVSHADNVIAVYAKSASDTQKSQVIENYNSQQTEWFASCISDSALVGFYFRQKEMTQKFDAIVQETKDLDVQVYLLRDNTQVHVEHAHETSEKIKRLLRAWDTLALASLPSS